MTLEEQLTARLAKIRWQQDLARRGQERKESVSPELAEALRNEIRTALEADGKPFDVNVARRVYDLAIAARDMCVAATGTVKEAIDQIQDTNGPMETLVDSSAPQPSAQVAETYGARIMRELIAMLPKLSGLPALGQSHEDSQTVVAAIADARLHGMHDLAAKLEQKLVGTPLEKPKITHTEVVANSYEHGFVDGSMQDNFERGLIDGNMSLDRQHWSPAYREGYEAGQARRQQLDQISTSPPPASQQSTAPPPAETAIERDIRLGLTARQIREEIISRVGMLADARTLEMQARYDAALEREGLVDSMTGPVHPQNVDSVGLCTACKMDPDPRGPSACHDCRDIARAVRLPFATECAP